MNYGPLVGSILATELSKQPPVKKKRLSLKRFGMAIIYIITFLLGALAAVSIMYICLVIVAIALAFV